MTNLTIAAISFMLETNWWATHVITPVQGYQVDTTVYYSQTARVELVEYRTDSVKGRQIKREVDREYKPEISTNIPPRLWPTNAPPNMLSSNPYILLRHRQDHKPVPEPPLPPK